MDIRCWFMPMTRIVLTFLRRLLCSSLLKYFFSLKRSFRKSTWPSRLSRWWYFCHLLRIVWVVVLVDFLLVKLLWDRLVSEIVSNEIVGKDFHRTCKPWFGIERVFFEGLHDVGIGGLVQDWPVDGDDDDFVSLAMMMMMLILTRKMATWSAPAPRAF